jgi:hypothetical protein
LLAILPYQRKGWLQKGVGSHKDLNTLPICKNFNLQVVDSLKVYSKSKYHQQQHRSPYKEIPFKPQQALTTK